MDDNEFKTYDNGEEAIYDENSIERDYKNINDDFKEPDVEEVPLYDDGYNPYAAGPQINYDNISEKTKDGKGLKIFFVVLAVFVALAIAMGAGYVMGKNPASFGNPDKIFVEKAIELEDVPEDKDALTPAGVYDKCNDSIVGIVVYNSAGQGGSASGVIYSEDGYIITNDHIYADVKSPKFRVYTSSGKDYAAVYVGGDTRSDVAVIKITDTNDKFKPASFGDSDKLVVGQRVVAIGRPMDAVNSSSITEGIVSMLNARVTSSSNYSNPAIQTNTAINPGSSGGALLNMYGQVVGITSSKIVGDEYEGIGYAIPSADAAKIAESLVQHGKVVNRAKMGITYQEIDSVTADINGIDTTGLLVVEVTNGDLTSSLTKDDIITHVNGIAITRDDIILDIIADSLPGETIALTVLKSDNSTKQITAKLLADEGSSSLDTSSPNKNNIPSSDDSSNGSSFTFPFGE